MRDIEVYYIYGVRYPTDLKSAGFQSQLEASRVFSHTEEYWYNETVCLWMPPHCELSTRAENCWLTHTRKYKALFMNWALR